MRKLRLILLAGCLFIILSACGKEEVPEIIEEVVPIVEAVVEPEPEPIPEPEPEPEPEPILPYTLKLTGEGSEEEINDRPVMVIIENSPRARPQSGLHQADIVYETLAEGNITRFIAVFQSQSPELIGPVRSMRAYLVHIGFEMDSIMAHVGGSPEALNMLKQKGANLDQIANSTYYWRSSDRSAPHNVYTSIELIRKGAEARKFRDESKDLELVFTNEAFEGEMAKEVTIHYIQGYYVSYEYEEEKGGYRRFMLGEPHNDRESSEPLVAHNIIIAESPHKILDSVGRRDIGINGPGNGYMLQLGKMKKITWENKNGIFRGYEDGKEIEWIPGKTWIHIVPIGAKIEL